jgi:heme iron utilization protein
MPDQARPDPVAVADDAARRFAAKLLAADHAALAFTDPQTGTPGISRIAFGLGPEGQMLTLISNLAAHYAALKAHPTCALLLGEPGPKGDPLTHPRLMIRAVAEFIDPQAQERPALRDHWLKTHPKAKLYIDFADFGLVRFTALSALLNGGFGKAFHLQPADLQI